MITQLIKYLWNENEYTRMHIESLQYFKSIISQQLQKLNNL